MSCCPQINTNTKLYQKFMEKKFQQKMEAGGKVDYGKFNRSASNFKQSKHSIEDENTNTSNTSNLSTMKSQDSEGINYLLKKELQKERSKTTIAQFKLEKMQAIPKEKRELQLDIDYLRAQNKQLKERLFKQQQKRSTIQQESILMSLKLKSLQQELQVMKLKHRQALQQSQSWKLKYQQLNLRHNASQNIQELLDQITKLKEQNYLAKDYIYKLTLKLYQLQQKNKILNEYLNNKNSSNSLINHQNTKQVKSTFQPVVQQSVTRNNTNSQQSPSTRIIEIQRQLEEINTSRVLKGKNRRKKIELQRQLQYLRSL